MIKTEIPTLTLPEVWGKLDLQTQLVLEYSLHKAFKSRGSGDLYDLTEDEIYFGKTLTEYVRKN